MSEVIPFPTKCYTSTPPDWSLIPRHMHFAIENYVERGILDDSFLEAILCNDLKMAVQSADSININMLANYVKFFWRYCPFECWGDVLRVSDWMKRQGLNGDQN